MSTLTISDLSLDKELDAKAMTAVTGGYSLAKMHRRHKPRRWAPRRPRPVVRNVQKNTVNFGTANSFIGITSGVNNGTQTINGGIHL